MNNHKSQQTGDSLNSRTNQKRALTTKIKKWHWWDCRWSGS